MSLRGKIRRQIQKELVAGKTPPNEVKAAWVHGPYYCCYCGRLIVRPLQFTVEHLRPVSKGGNNSFYNTFPCCHACNTWRSNTQLDNWLFVLSSYVTRKQDRPPYHSVETIKVMVENVNYLMDYLQRYKQYTIQNKNISTPVIFFPQLF